MGTVKLALHYDNYDIFSQKPNFAKALPFGGHIYGWEARDIICEVVISNPRVHIPETMKIDESKGVLIRILCRTDNIWSNEEGIEIDLPKIEKNEICQFHIYIAWKLKSDKYDASTWYAVDQGAKQILECEGLL